MRYLSFCRILKYLQVKISKCHLLIQKVSFQRCMKSPKKQSRGLFRKWGFGSKMSFTFRSLIQCKHFSFWIFSFSDWIWFGITCRCLTMAPDQECCQSRLTHTATDENIGFRKVKGFVVSDCFWLKFRKVKQFVVFDCFFPSEILIWPTWSKSFPLCMASWSKERINLDLCWLSHFFVENLFSF